MNPLTDAELAEVFKFPVWIESTDGDGDTVLVLVECRDCREADIYHYSVLAVYADDGEGDEPENIVDSYSPVTTIALVYGMEALPITRRPSQAEMLDIGVLLHQKGLSYNIWDEEE